MPAYRDVTRGITSHSNEKLRRVLLGRGGAMRIVGPGVFGLARLPDGW